MEKDIISLEEIKDLKPRQNTFGLVGKIVRGSIFDAHIKEEHYEYVEPSQDSNVEVFNVISGDVYSFIYDLYERERLLKKNVLSSPASDAYTSLLESFFMEAREFYRNLYTIHHKIF